MTINDWLKDTTQKLTSNGTESARLDSILLLEHVLVTPRATLLAHPETDLPATTLVKLDIALQQRLSGLPIAYILNKKEFYGRDFIVSSDVLIPRPETESIVEIAKDLLLTSPKILDIGTGSGCIAITLALEIPKSKVTGSDVSDEALAVAKQNAKALGAQVTFLHANLLQGLGNKHFDLICANLPYVPDGIVTSVEITQEPSTALFSGADGLNHYKTFFVQIAESANKPTYIITESLEYQHQALKKLASLAGYKLTKTDVLAQLFERVRT